MKNINYNKLNEKTLSYYERKFRKFGANFKGSDWNSKSSQEIRFNQLLKVIASFKKVDSILDFGCGYGALYPYVSKKISECRFYGYDISSIIIEKAKSLHPHKNCKWITDLKNIKEVDYTIASGVFNVMQNNKEEDWLNYVLETLTLINSFTIEGFSFNILTKYSDKNYMKDYLFYADPCFLFDFCKKNFSKNVSLLHDYSLYEFTIIVKKY